MKQTRIVGILILTCLIMTGCPGESERMAKLAETTVTSQSAANTANAKTQDNFVNLSRGLQLERSNLQSERQSLNQQFENLENDRRSLHRLRRSELAWSESFRFLAIIIAAITPLFLCAYLIWAASYRSVHQDELNEILIQELTSARPRLIRAPNLSAIEHQPDRESDHPGEFNADGATEYPF